MKITRPIDRFLILNISVYQKLISPYKGFSCAHRVYHKGESCSEYIKDAIDTHGLKCAIPKIKDRLKNCRMAYLSLLNIDTIYLAKQKKKKKKSSTQSNACDSIDCGTAPCEVLDCCSGFDF